MILSCPLVNLHTSTPGNKELCGYVTLLLSNMKKEILFYFILKIYSCSLIQPHLFFLLTVFLDCSCSIL